MKTVISMDGVENGSQGRAFWQRAQDCSRDKTRLTEAVRWSRLAVEAEPENAYYWAFLGRDLTVVGQLTEGVDCLRRAAEMMPADPQFRASYLWTLNYLPEMTPEKIGQAYGQWGDDFASPSFPATYDLDKDPERRLRVGYLSPDFCRHSVAYYIEPVLDGHDRQQVELFGYGNVPAPDLVTERLRHKFDRYVDVRGWSNERISKRIRNDRIDILVPLAGHCVDNCLLALVNKPAPIQVDLGGITTTGMRQIDYRISDEVVEPPAAQAWTTETLTYLPGGWSVFTPPQVSPIIGPLPAMERGYVTFGSFNNRVKLNDPLIALWAEILKRCPQSRLLIKCLSVTDAGVCREVTRKFEAQGVDSDRLDFCGELPYGQHLERLAQVDLALDATPFNGGMTTLEGLWMGVPIVTLSGATCVSRTGRSILHRLGLEIFAADSPQEYVEKACAFAGQPKQLAEIRQALRGMMLNSPLCRPGRMAGELEAAYRMMWRQWCRTQ